MDNSTNTKNQQTVSGSRQERLVTWLRSQWEKSFAIHIWNDLTPLGKATMFLPLYLLCMIAIPFMALMIPILLLLAGVEKIIAILTPIFFAK